MKKTALISIFFLFILYLIFFISCSFDRPIDPEVKKEIRGLETSSYSISAIADQGKYFYVKIRFNYKPTHTRAVSGGLGVCGQVLGILKRHSMEKDITVAVISPTRVKDKVFLYGFAEYSRVTGEYDWKPYKNK